MQRSKQSSGDELRAKVEFQCPRQPKNAPTIEFRIKPYIKGLQSLYLKSKQQNTDFMWNWVDGKIKNVHKDCTGNILGDEFHYLLEKEIKKYLPKFYLQHVDTLISELLSSQNLKLSKQLRRLISIMLGKF